MKRGHVVGTCASTGKQQYETETAARREVRASKKNNTSRLRGQYRCADCGLWHTTSMRSYASQRVGA